MAVHAVGLNAPKTTPAHWYADYCVYLRWLDERTESADDWAQNPDLARRLAEVNRVKPPRADYLFVRILKPQLRREKQMQNLTRKAVLKLAQKSKRFRGGVYINEHPEARTAAERPAMIQKSAELKSRLAELDAELKAIPDPIPALLDAAQFVVDVEGDTPSIPELAAALAIVKRRRDLQQERSDVHAERRKVASLAHRVRCELFEVDNSGPLSCGFHVASGDTWEELAHNAKLIEGYSVDDCIRDVRESIKKSHE